ncbi:MAG: marine proteobacterial sortase target protein [Hyphomicrobiaceae bacterium]|nr:marine proteobacterial sortase target protein [Hyphomicrobiaceae bacterium]
MKSKRSNRCVREFVRDFSIGVAVFVAVIVLAILDSRAARPAPAIGSAAPAPSISVSPDWAEALSANEVKSGTLVVRKVTGDDKTTIQIAPAQRLDTNVDVTVSGPVARTTVTQRFRNTGNTWVEGIYAYPLPARSTVDTLSMRIGKRVIRGEIVPRAVAQELFEVASSTGRNTKPPVRYRPDMFMASVARIAPGEVVKVKIEFQELLRGNGGIYALRIPLVAAPRLAPKSYLQPVKLDGHAGVPGQAGHVDKAGDQKVNRVSLRVRINAGFPLGEVKSESHEISLRRTGDATAIVSLHQGAARADRDFELTWDTKRAAAPLTTAFHQKLGEDDYILTMLAPPKASAAPLPMSREVVFVVDSSVSMKGKPLDQVRQSLTSALERLRPGDRFNIIGFNGENAKLFREPVAVTKSSLGIAAGFVERMRAEGEALMLPALEAALADSRKKDSQRVRQIVLLTGGAVSSDSAFLSTLAQKRGRSRVFIVGIGSIPNEPLMRRAAEIGRGAFMDIPSQAEISDKLSAFFERLERPVITDLKLEWASGVRVDSWPNPLPDLYLNAPLILTARISALKGEMKLSGKIAGQPWSQKIALTDSRIGSGIGRFWARHKVASLKARSYTGQSAHDVNRAIETVALAHGLVGRTTSLVAIDVTPPRPENQPLASESLPIDLPAGWIYDNNSNTRLAGLTGPSDAKSNGRFGEKNQALRIVTSPTAGKAVADKTALEQAALRLAGKTNANGALQGTQPSDSAADGLTSRTWILTTMAVIFSLMSALTLGLWRHLRRSVEPARRRRGDNQAF